MGMEHGFRVGSVTSRKLNMYLPSAIKGYCTALAAASAEGTPLGDLDVAELAARHAMRVTGPVPDGYL